MWLMPAEIDGCLRPGRVAPYLATAVFIAGAALFVGAARAAPPPELILFHGRILTVDAQDSIVEALAIRDGNIVAVGSDRDILRLAGASTQRIDLHGQTATPGLIDSHAHIADGGVG